MPEEHGCKRAVCITNVPSRFSRVQLFVTPWAVALQASLSMGFSRLLCPWDSPGKNTGVGCHASSRGSSTPRDQKHISLVSSAARWVLDQWHCLGILYYQCLGTSVPSIPITRVQHSDAIHIPVQATEKCVKPHPYVLGERLLHERL